MKLSWLLLIVFVVLWDSSDVINGNIHSSATSQLEVSSNNDCEQKKSADEFPADVFSQQQRIHGAFLIHLLVLAYCFLFVAFVCQDYFLPAVFCICSELRVSPDVAAATFMASATSVPEMCINVIATFVTKSDLGIGTIVGGSVNNTLAVAGVAGLAVRKSIKLEKWPLLRDSFIHICVLAVLALILSDGIVVWTEALVLVVLYFIYFFVMLTQKRIHSFICKLTNFTSFLFPCARKRVYNVQRAEIYTVCDRIDNNVKLKPTQDQSKPPKDIIELYEAEKQNKILKLWKWFTFPIRFLLSSTVPDCKSRTRIYPLTFIMSVVWIGLCSYVACWMTTILGETFNVPDIVMGMIFLSVCGNIPETSSAFINARNDIGSMSISNTLGANTLDILLSLGMPWLVKTSLPQSYGGGSVHLSTGDLLFNCIGLASSVLILNIIAAVNHYRMNRIFGFSCLFSYFGIIVLFVIVSLGIVGIFSVSNGTAC
ncbi:sodium/potassium/calcium exchanger 3-like [Planococcus citri]|uniref:sodium/potassium/calcium exchanger 3-like n=1 Tax=Planococcus citri TaxID=170843 RepID=UPI0031F78238